MLVRIQQKNVEPKILIFSSQSTDLLISWLQYLNKNLNAVWNLKYHESQVCNKQLPLRPDLKRKSSIVSQLESLDIVEPHDSRPSRHNKYAEVLSRLQQRKEEAPSSHQTRRFSYHSDSNDYGVFDVESEESDNDYIDTYGTEIEYSEYRSSHYHDSIISDATLKAEIESEISIHNEQITLQSAEQPDLWKHLNRASNETKRLFGALDLAMIPDLPISTTNTVSTAIIGYASYLLHFNKMSRTLECTPIVKSLDSLIGHYYEFSNKVLTGLGDHTEESGSQNVHWELEWEINELRSIAGHISEDLIALMEEI